MVVGYTRRKFADGDHPRLHRLVSSGIYYHPCCEIHGFLYGNLLEAEFARRESPRSGIEVLFALPGSILRASHASGNGSSKIYTVLFI